MKNVPNFLGVYSRDTLPTKMKSQYPISLISNTDLQLDEGTHWVAFYIDDNGKGHYFDSYGRPPIHDEFENFLANHCPGGYSWNRKKLQCDTCVTCGQYCCCYIILRSAGLAHKQFQDLFTHDPQKNDQIVDELFKVLKNRDGARYH